MVKAIEWSLSEKVVRFSCHIRWSCKLSELPRCVSNKLSSLACDGALLVGWYTSSQLVSTGSSSGISCDHSLSVCSCSGLLSLSSSAEFDMSLSLVLGFSVWELTCVSAESPVFALMDSSAISSIGLLSSASCISFCRSRVESCSKRMACCNCGVMVRLCPILSCSDCFMRPTISLLSE